MLPSRQMFTRLLETLSTDADNLEDDTEPLLHFALISEPFTPRADLTLADLTLLETGFLLQNMILADAEDVEWWIDALPGDYWIRGVSKSGGFWFEADGSPQTTTIYGLALVGVGGTKLFATMRYENPPVFTEMGEYMFVDPHFFHFPLSCIR